MTQEATPPAAINRRAGPAGGYAMNRRQLLAALAAGSAVPVLGTEAPRWVLEFPNGATEAIDAPMQVDFTIDRRTGDLVPHSYTTTPRDFGPRVSGTVSLVGRARAFAGLLNARVVLAATRAVVAAGAILPSIVEAAMSPTTAGDATISGLDSIFYGVGGSGGGSSGYRAGAGAGGGGGGGRDSVPLILRGKIAAGIVDAPRLDRPIDVAHGSDWSVSDDLTDDDERLAKHYAHGIDPMLIQRRTWWHRDGRMMASVFVGHALGRGTEYPHSRDVCARWEGEHIVDHAVVTVLGLPCPVSISGEHPDGRADYGRLDASFREYERPGMAPLCMPIAGSWWQAPSRYGQSRAVSIGVPVYGSTRADVLDAEARLVAVVSGYLAPMLRSWAIFGPMGRPDVWPARHRMRRGDLELVIASRHERAWPAYLRCLHADGRISEHGPTIEPGETVVRIPAPTQHITVSGTVGVPGAVMVTGDGELQRGERWTVYADAERPDDDRSWWSGERARR